MKITYAREHLQKSIFLAGPTPRKNTTIPSWRPAALELLKDFEGEVFVPEDSKWGESKFDYDDQVTWEWEALNQATCILFWIPRDLEQMPAFTTNVEFGLFAHSSKVVLGAPQGAAKMTYLFALAHRYNIPVYHTLEETVLAAIHKAYNPF